MLREGPISHTIHGGIEYAAGVLFIVSQFAFGFDADAAKALSVVIGVALIFVAATTHGPTSLVNSLPVSVHVLVDYALAALLIAIPFLFGFYNDDTNATVFFIVLGVAHLLITIGTRFERDKAPSKRRVE